MECTACHNTIIDDAVFCPYCGTRQPEAVEPDEYTYAAFISYRHKSPDKEVAAKVHSAVETYQLPSSVAQAYGSKTIGKVFRDKDELPVTTHLPNDICKALKRSRSLIVICSPETKESAWVAQEIELFTSYHGRDRIFAVLADGTSAESIPQQLREQPFIDNGGSIATKTSEPLAADFRSSEKQLQHFESLRLIAALASCPFDDLVKRHKTRKNKRIATAITAAACIVAAIAFFAFHAVQGYQLARIAEYEQLAAEAREELSQGNRYEAIEKALAALPESSNDTSRPVPSEAVSVLEEAVGAKKGTFDFWQSAYSITTDNNITVIDNGFAPSNSVSVPAHVGSISIGSHSSFLAIYDDEGTITTYDTLTGKKLTEIQPKGKEATDVPFVDMACEGHILCLAVPGAKGSLSCNIGRTGKLFWGIADVPVQFLTFSAELETLCAGVVDGKTIATVSIDASTGKSLSGSSAELSRAPSSVYGIKSAIGSTKQNCFVAVNGELLKTTPNDEPRLSTKLAFPTVTSLAYQNGLVIAASTEAQEGKGTLTLKYSIEAFDENLKRKWDYEGTRAIEILANGDHDILLYGYPEICKASPATKGLVVVKASDDVIALSAKTGKVKATRSFNSTVLAAAPCEIDDTPGTLFMCADGSGGSCSFEEDNVLFSSDSYHQFSFNEELRWGAFVNYNGQPVAIAASAKSNNRLIAKTSYDNDPILEPGKEHSLDELIAAGKEILSHRDKQ